MINYIKFMIIIIINLLIMIMMIRLWINTYTHWICISIWK